MKKYWEASLTGDLVCGHCGKTKPVILKGQIITVDGLPIKPSLLMCASCGKGVELAQEIIDLAHERARVAFPSGRPIEDGPKWKGDNLYDG